MLRAGRVYEGVSKRQIMVESIGVAFPSSESQVVINLDDPRNFTDDGVHSHGACVRQIAAHIVVEDDVMAGLRLRHSVVLLICLSIQALSCCYHSVKE